jgi:hypothetical protein
MPSIKKARKSVTSAERLQGVVGTQVFRMNGQTGFVFGEKCAWISIIRGADPVAKKKIERAAQSKRGKFKTIAEAGQFTIGALS